MCDEDVEMGGGGGADKSVLSGGRVKYFGRYFNMGHMYLVCILLIGVLLLLLLFI